MNDKTFLFSTRSLVHLQAEQIRVHSHEVSKIWQRVDEERETRIKLEAVGCLWKYILSCSWHQTTNSRILFSSFHESFSQSFHWSKTEKTMFWTNKKVFSFSMAQIEKYDDIRKKYTSIVQMLKSPFQIFYCKWSCDLCKLGITKLVLWWFDVTNRTEVYEKKFYFIFSQFWWFISFHFYQNRNHVHVHLPRTWRRWKLLLMPYVPTWTTLKPQVTTCFHEFFSSNIT